MAARIYSVYILANHSRHIYVGVTNDVARRVWQHRHGSPRAFTRRYGIATLVYVESFADVRAAIAREKQLKRWPRWRKDRLIDASNPTWADLASAWRWPHPAAAHASGDERREGDRGSEGDPDTRAGSADAPAG